MDRLSQIPDVFENLFKRKGIPLDKPRILKIRNKKRNSIMDDIKNK